MAMTLGIDLACRAAHVASLAGPDGTLIWRGRSLFTRTPLTWRSCGRTSTVLPGELTVVLEPTWNVWIVVAAWFRRRGARVVLVPTTQSADLRAYFAKHTKNDRLDSAILARLPLLHPGGVAGSRAGGPIAADREATFLAGETAGGDLPPLGCPARAARPGLVRRVGHRLWPRHASLPARYADPNTVIRLGQARLGRFLRRYSHGHWREGKAAELIAAAHQTLQLGTATAWTSPKLAAELPSKPNKPKS